MSLQTKLSALISAIGADIKQLKSSSSGSVQIKNPAAATVFTNISLVSSLAVINTPRGSASAWLVYSGVSDGKGFGIHTNGTWFVLPSTLSNTVFTGTLSATLGSGGFVNNFIFGFNASAGTSMGYYAAVTTTAVSTFTELMHPTLSTQWAAVAFNAGVYVFVGKNGNVTATKDFVTFKTWTIGAGNYHLTDITYSAVENKFFIVGAPTSATTSVVRTSNDGVYFAKLAIDFDADTATPTQLTLSGSIEAVGTTYKIAIDPVQGDCCIVCQDAALNVRGLRVARYVKIINSFYFADAAAFYTSTAAALNCIDNGNWTVVWNPVIDSFVIHPIKYQSLTPTSSQPIYLLPNGNTNRLIVSDNVSSSSTTTGGILLFNDGTYVQLRYIGTSTRLAVYPGNSLPNLSQPTINGVNLASPSVYNAGHKNLMLSMGGRSYINTSVSMSIFGEGSASTSQVNGVNLMTYTASTNNNKCVIQNTSGGGTYPLNAFWTRGRIYFELEYVSGTPTFTALFGVVDTQNTVSDVFLSRNPGPAFTTALILPISAGTGYGRNYTATFASPVGVTANGDVIRVAADFDKGQLWIKVNNGNWNNDANSDPARQINPIAFNTDGIPRLSSLYLSTSDPTVVNFRVIPEHLKYSVPFGFRLPETVYTHSSFSAIAPSDSAIISAEQGQQLVYDAGVITSKYEYESNAQNTELTAIDSFGVYTQVAKYWPSGTPGVFGNMFMKSVLSDGTAPYYTTRTETYYKRDGSVYGTAIYTLEYTNGVCTKETKQ